MRLDFLQLDFLQVAILPPVIPRLAFPQLDFLRLDFLRRAIPPPVIPRLAPWGDGLPLCGAKIGGQRHPPRCPHPTRHAACQRCSLVLPSAPPVHAACEGCRRLATCQGHLQG